MFEGLSNKLDGIFRKLRGRGILKEEDVIAVLKEVRMALLEADVNFKVVKDLVERIKERAIGQEVMKSLTPGHQVVRIVHEELTKLMGGNQRKIYLSPNPPTAIMLVGLQGSGKTTTAGKLAKGFKKEGRRPLLVAADTQRPAAIEQLSTLSSQISVDFYGTKEKDNPLSVCENAFLKGKREGFDPVIMDTAGRLHIDDDLMNELKSIKEKIHPYEILLVADAMTGQDAVNIAKRFDEVLDLTGIILTKMDGDARGGAALSMMAVTGKPIKMIGVGEKLDLLESFHPERMASRILGMGDVLSIIEKAEASIEKEEALELERRLRTDSFTLDDFRTQLKQMRKMGPLDHILDLIPGIGRFKSEVNIDDRELIKVEAIIDSMTKKERANYAIINGSRRKRIARGSGTTVTDVNRVLKQFVQMKRMMKAFSGKGGLRAMKEVMRWR
jgi:signal recognition particle subunit SRP54